MSLHSNQRKADLDINLSYSATLMLGSPVASGVNRSFVPLHVMMTASNFFYYFSMKLLSIVLVSYVSLWY